MKLISRKNEYQHNVVDCLFCAKWVYVRMTAMTSPDPLRDLKRHITNEAKNEAFAVALIKNIGDAVATPHLDYYRDHTSEVPAVPKVSAKRAYDNDMSL